MGPSSLRHSQLLHIYKYKIDHISILELLTVQPEVWLARAQTCLYIYI